MEIQDANVTQRQKKNWNTMSKAYVKPTSNFIAWEKKDKKAIAINVMGLHDSLLQNVIGTKRTKETWDGLLKIYETKGLTKKLFLK